MSNEKARFDLNDLARVLRRDVEELPGAAGRRRGRKKVPKPFANAVAAVEELRGRLEEIRKSAVEKRKQQAEARDRFLTGPLDELREAHEKGVERRMAKATAPKAGRYAVAGRVVDSASGIGLAGVRVRVVDPDTLRDARRAERLTDELGFYRGEFAPQDFANAGRPAPESLVRIVGEDGQVLQESDRTSKLGLGKVAVVHFAMDGARLPRALEMSRRHARKIEAELEEIDRERKTIAGRAAIRKGKITGGVTLEPKKPGTPAAPVGGVKPDPKKPGVRQVRGIGPVLAARLEARNITTAARVAAMEPGALAKALEISEAQATRIVEAARELVG